MMTIELSEEEQILRLKDMMAGIEESLRDKVTFDLLLKNMRMFGRIKELFRILSSIESCRTSQFVCLKKYSDFRKKLDKLEIKLKLQRKVILSEQFAVSG